MQNHVQRKSGNGSSGNEEKAILIGRYNEMVMLFHPPTIGKVLGMVGLSLCLLTSLQKMQNHSLSLLPLNLNRSLEIPIPSNSPPKCRSYSTQLRSKTIQTLVREACMKLEEDYDSTRNHVHCCSEKTSHQALLCRPQGHGLY